MRRYILVGSLLFGSALCAVNAAETPSDRLHTPSVVPTDAALAKLGLRKVWTANVGAAGRRDGLASAQAFNGQIVTQTLGGAFTALDAETGAAQWRLRLGEPFQSHQTPVGANRNYFFFYSGLTLTGVERKTGLVEWTLKLPLPLQTAPSADDAYLYLTTSDHKIHVYFLPLTRQLKSDVDQTAYDAMLSKRGLSAEKYGSSAPKEMWSFDLGSELAAPPAAFGSHIVLGDARGNVCCFENGRRYMSDSFRTAGGIVAPIAQDGDAAYVASTDHHLHAVELIAGRMEPRWQFTAGSRIVQKPIVVGDDVFVVGATDGAHRLDRATGKELWSQPRAQTILAVSPRLVIAADGNKHIVTLDRQRGAVLGSWDASSYAMLLGNDQSDRAYLANRNGLVICLRDADASCAAPHKYETKLSSAMATAAREFSKSKQAAEKQAAEEKAKEQKSKEDKGETGEEGKKDEGKPTPQPPKKADAKGAKPADKKDEMKDDKKEEMKDK